MQVVDNTVVLIHPEDFEYPLSLYQFRERHKNVMFGDTIPVELLNMYGYQVVQTTDKPAGDVVFELPPIEQDGVWTQQWVSRPFNEQETVAQLQELKQAALYHVQEAVEYTRFHGAPYTFPNSQVRHIQLRQEDIANLTGLGLKADRDRATTFYFRTFENDIQVLTGDQMHDMTNTAFEKFTALMQANWQTQEQINAATSKDQVPTKEQIRQQINSSVE